jgi:hemoglobin
MSVGQGPTHGESQSFFDAIGGHATFEAIVREFYRGIESDPVLRPMYPEGDLEGAIDRLTKFLEQYWGGPTTYSEERGHPRLRMRHQPFRVNPEARDHWIDHMRHAVAQQNLAPLHAVTLMDYLERAAYSMVNTFDASEG